MPLRRSKARRGTTATFTATFTATLIATILSGAALAQPKPAPPARSTLDDASDIRVLLAADLETTLSSQMNGTLADLRATLGQRVARSALLVRMACEEPQARAKVAEAELAMAKQNLEAKRAMGKLNAAGDLEIAVAATEVAKTTGANTLAQTQAGYCQVNAPFKGRVAKVHVKPFQTVSVGTPLLDLVSDGALKVRLNVPSSMLARLQVGVPLDVRIHETGKTYPAKVSAISSRVDAVAQTVELEARLNAEHAELMAGMSGTARFPDSR